MSRSLLNPFGSASRLALFAGVILASASVDAQQFSTVSFGVAAGLSNLNTTSVFEDHTGRVWVGTENGVFAANGATFEKQQAFQKAGLEAIDVLREDSSGRLWAMDDKSIAYEEAGIVHFIPALQNVSLGRDANLMVLADEPDSVFLLNEGSLERVATFDNGRSWQVTPALSPQLLERNPELTRLTVITPAGSDRFWAACGRSLCLVNFKQQTVDRRSESQAAETWKFLYLARDGALWARSEHEVAVLRPSGFHRLTPPAATRLDARTPLVIEDAQGRILLNLCSGLARITEEGKERWEIIDEKKGLPRQELDTLAFTRAGDLWMGAFGHGLTLLRGYDQWESWTEADGLSSSVIWPMSRDSFGALWVANAVTVDRIDPQTHRITSMAARLPAHHISALIVDRRDHVWAANSDGQLFEIDARTRSVRLAATGLGKVMKLLEDAEGTIWICARNGLYFLTAADRRSRPKHADSGTIPPGYAWYITQGPNRTLWLSTEHGLFRRQQGGPWQPIKTPVGVLEHYLIAAAPDGTLWMQNKDPYPLLHLRVEGAEVKLINEEQAAILGSDNLTFVDIDRRGWLWVGSDAGVSIFNGARWIACSIEDGLVWDDTDFHAFYQAPDGSAWIGTSGGISHVLHPERLFTTPPPGVVFENATLANQPLAHSGEDARTFDLRSPTLNAELLDTAYDRGSALSYRYRLEGLEDTWGTTTGSIHYSSLAPGDYTLSVIAYDDRRHQSSPHTNLSFHILAPWWRRPWCLALEGLLAVLLLSAGWRLRVRFLLERQQALERLVSDRTSELMKEKIELSAARAELLAMSRRDSLTSLLSRAAIFEEMQQLCEATIRTGKPLAYAMADLDSFKKINDEFGHVAGDTVLRECAARMRGVLHPGELAGRYGGEEMLILLPGLKPDEVRTRLEDLREVIANDPVLHGAEKIEVTCSFGLAWFGNEGISLEILIHRADQALYRAKKNGRNRVEVAIESVAHEGVPAPDPPTRHGESIISLNSRPSARRSG